MIGIIGSGRFGKLAIKYLKEDAEVFVFDKLDCKKEITSMGVKPATLRKVCQQQIIILCVPISNLESLLKKIKNQLRKNALLVDVCSVKEYPVKLMQKYLPENIQILGTHPMFGPDSALYTLSRRKIVLCRVRVNRGTYLRAKSYLRQKKLRIIETTPLEHDRQIADSLILTHFIGRGLIKYGALKHDIETMGYKRLLRILDTVEHDTWQLFEDMNKYNRFAETMRHNFLQSLQKIDEKLER
ncbi:prephenate dehydrogenase/arogenate dehydrogenase family protein [Candidatus Riflebacteria bacterium]